MKLSQEQGALHLICIVILFFGLAAFWVFMGWQQHIDRVHAQLEVTKQRVEMLETRVKTLEAKVGL
jgi:cell division protein FtsB